MDALVFSLIAWITANTGLAAHEPPRIVLLPKDQLSHLFRSPDRLNRLPQASSLENQSDAHRAFGVQAFYLRDKATVYLPQTWRLSEIRDQGILLHELVHHVQRFNKVKPPCPAALERQAYDLQAAWLREQGVADPYEMIGTDEFTVAILTACMPPDG